MSGMVALTQEVWFRVRGHEDAGFSPHRAYRALAISDYSESAMAQVWLISDHGYLWAVPQRDCVVVHPHDFSRRLRASEWWFRVPARGRGPRSDW
jgi:hypothetical protein